MMGLNLIRSNIEPIRRHKTGGTAQTNADMTKASHLNHAGITVCSLWTKNIYIIVGDCGRCSDEVGGGSAEGVVLSLEHGMQADHRGRMTGLQKEKGENRRVKRTETCDFRLQGCV